VPVLQLFRAPAFVAGPAEPQFFCMSGIEPVRAESARVRSDAAAVRSRPTRFWP